MLEYKLELHCFARNIVINEDLIGDKDLLAVEQRCQLFFYHLLIVCSQIHLINLVLIYELLTIYHHDHHRRHQGCISLKVFIVVNKDLCFVTCAIMIC